jgi:hypothetical protein
LLIGEIFVAWKVRHFVHSFLRGMTAEASRFPNGLSCRRLSYDEGTHGSDISEPEHSRRSVVEPLVRVDVRLVVVAALVLLTGCLAVGFTRAALSIRREHEARFRHIRQRLEEDATSIMKGLFGRDR